MRKKELLKKLREYQSWRKGADTPMMPPSEVTRMIDSAITVIEKSDTSKANAVLFKKKSDRQTSHHCRCSDFGRV